MKTVCPICNQRKAKRRCWRQNMEEICPLCCAGKRGPECGDCPYYSEAQRYASARAPSAANPTKHFTIVLDPEVEKAVDEAMILVERGHFHRAGEALAPLLREHPRDHLVLYGMGTVHAKKREYQEAIRYFDQAIAIFPYFTEAYFNKAVACQELLDLDGAFRAFRKVVEVGDPDDTTVKKARSFLDNMAATIRRTEGVDFDIFLESQAEFNRAFAFMEKGDWSRALAGFRAAVAKHDRSAPAHGNMGLCLALLGRKAEALAELDRALKIDPRYEPALTNRVAVERMEEGRPLGNVYCKSIDYGREKFLREQGR